MRATSIAAGTLAIALCLACASAPADAQRRQSLEQRIAALEQLTASNEGNIDLQNQVAALRSELQALRGDLEQLQQQARERAEADAGRQRELDARLARLEAPPVAPVLPASPSTAAEAPPATVATVATPAPGSALPAEERAAYTLAFDALKAGEYAKSARLFQQFLQAHPNGQYAPNALYWLGESYYVTQNYELALQQFDSLLARFPTHGKAADGLYKRGMTLYGLKRDADAQAALRLVGERYHGSEAARLAAERLKAGAR